MSMSGFLYSDIIKFIIPSLIGIMLFAPLLGIDLNISYVVLASIALGYLLSGTLMRARLLEKTPYFKKRVEIKDMMNKLWDNTQMYYLLDKNDRDDTQLSAAYIMLYYFTSLYLFIYLLVNLGMLLFHPVNHDYWSTTWSMQTNLAGELQYYTWVIVIIAGVLLFYTFKQSMFLYEILFFPGNEYEKLAKKVESNNSGVILKNPGLVHGVLMANKKGVKDVELRLYRGDRCIAKTTTLFKGLFLFDGELTFDQNKPSNNKYEVAQSVGNDKYKDGFEIQEGNEIHLTLNYKGTT